MSTFCGSRMFRCSKNCLQTGKYLSKHTHTHMVPSRWWFFLSSFVTVYDLKTTITLFMFISTGSRCVAGHRNVGFLQVHHSHNNSSTFFNHRKWNSSDKNDFYKQWWWRSPLAMFLIVVYLDSLCVCVCSVVCILISFYEFHSASWVVKVSPQCMWSITRKRKLISTIALQQEWMNEWVMMEVSVTSAWWTWTNFPTKWKITAAPSPLRKLHPDGEGNLRIERFYRHIPKNSFLTAEVFHPACQRISSRFYYVNVSDHHHKNSSSF